MTNGFDSIIEVIVAIFILAIFAFAIIPALIEVGADPELALISIVSIILLIIAVILTFIVSYVRR